MFLVNQAMVDLQIGTAGLVALLGYAVVFVGLIALMVVILIEGKFAVAKDQKTEAPKAAAPAAPAAAPSFSDEAKADLSVASPLAGTVVPLEQVKDESFAKGMLGPGIGTMTQYLAESARHVIAVEIDQNLIPILKDTLSAYENVTVINKDILKVDIQALAQEYNGGRPIKVVANLPYYITTPIIMGLFESNVPIDNITVMVQK